MVFFRAILKTVSEVLGLFARNSKDGLVAGAARLAALVSSRKLPVYYRVTWDLQPPELIENAIYMARDLQEYELTDREKDKLALLNRTYIKRDDLETALSELGITRFDGWPGLFGNEEKQETENSRSDAQAKRHCLAQKEVLGAAIAVLVAYFDDCIDKRSGRVAASQIANMIDQHAHLFWGDGKTPLQPKTMTKHISEWLKKVEISK